MITKKTYIPGKPRNKKLTNVTSGSASVGKTEFNQVAGESHTHANKGVLDQITEAMLDIIANAVTELVKSDDTETELTDENVLSSLRTLLEIKNRAISKVEEDTAAELITFLKGIIAGGTSEFAEMIVSGKITAKDIDVTDNLKTSILQVLVSATLQNAILKGQFNSETFVSGFLGEGFRLSKINDRWTLELDDLIVRKTMQVYELIVQRIRYQGGQVLHSPAGGKITKVTNGGTYWRVEHDSPDDFITNDQVQCQNFKVGSAAQNPDGSTTFEGVSVKRYWRLVTSYGRGWFNLSKTDMEAGSAEPEVGDDIVVLGNRTDATRQNAYMIVSTGANSPYTAHVAGINSYSTAGKEVVREGNLSGIVDPDFGQLLGYGLYSQNAYLKGIFRLLNGQTVQEYVGGEVEGLRTETDTAFDILEGKINSKVSQTAYDVNNQEISNKFTEVNQDINSWGVEVGKKVGNNEVISKINVTPETIKINAEKIQFTGSASFQAAAKEVADASVNDLKIGDVNLARYSGAGYYLNSAGVLAGIYPEDRSKSSVVTEGGISAIRVLNGGIIRINQVTGLTEGKTYTWRIMIKGTTDLSGNWYNWNDVMSYNGTNLNITADWAVYTKTFVCQGSSEILHIADFGSTFYIADWMLVEGNRVTEGWGANILDTEAKIESAKQEALTAAGNAQTTANAAQTATNNLNTTMNGAFRDGVIDAAEAKAIEKSVNLVNETMAKAEASYNKVYTNTYLEGTAKTNLLNAKINLWGQRDTLLSAINTAISGGSTTPAQKTAYDNAFATFNSLMLAFQNAIEDANKAIQATIESAANQYTDGRVLRTTQTVDARSLDPNTYYPVVIKMSAAIPYRIRVYRTLSGTADGVPSWSTHANGFAVNCEWTSIGNGWGTIGVRRIIERFEYLWSTVVPVGSIGQMVNSSYEYIYVRGGSRYHFIVEGSSVVEIALKTETFTVSSQSISPVTSIIAPVITTDAIDTKAADALAKANTSKAITDNFTSIEGGLITSTMIQLRPTTSAPITAGMSAIQGSNNELPAFWSGGTYAQAIAGTAKAIDRHDGSGHRAGGALKWDAAGNTEFTGKITAPTGKIGEWNIVSGKLTAAYGSGAGISISENGGRFLEIQTSSDSSAVMSIRNDGGMALRLYTQAVAGLALSINAQTGGTAIRSAGGHYFMQRSGEKWTAPGVLGSGQFTWTSTVITAVKTWSVEGVSFYTSNRSGNNFRLVHNLGHTDYVCFPNAVGSSAHIRVLDRTINYVEFEVISFGSDQQFFLMLIGRNVVV